MMQFKLKDKQLLGSIIKWIVTISALNIEESDINRIIVNKEDVFKGLYNIDYMKKICNKYTDYTKFIREQRGVYNKVYYLGLLDTLTSHMKITNENEISNRED
jgi:hypothetical protein